MSGGDVVGAERRVWAQVPPGTRDALAGMSPTDLQTLLLHLARMRAEKVTPADLARRWREDRFVRPAACDPRDIAAIEARMWQLLPPEVGGVELAPVVPLGACAALGPVNQNRIVTTMRSVEVLSDPTNALAIEAAARRRQQPPRQRVHLAAVHRVVRAQDFGPGWSPHFRLFAVVSSARDAGSGATEAALLTLQLGYWQRLLAALVPAATPRLQLTVFDSPVVGERVRDTVLPALAGSDAAVAPVVEDPGRTRGRGYYVDAALRITVQDGGDDVEIGDGGFTTWTSRLMNNGKERCLISCVATERLAAVARTFGGETAAP